jgi:hypothetical protein
LTRFDRGKFRCQAPVLLITTKPSATTSRNTTTDSGRPRDPRNRFSWRLKEIRQKPRSRIV